MEKQRELVYQEVLGGAMWSCTVGLSDEMEGWNYEIRRKKSVKRAGQVKPSARSLETDCFAWRNLVRETYRTQPTTANPSRFLPDLIKELENGHRLMGKVKGVKTMANLPLDSMLRSDLAHYAIPRQLLNGDIVTDFLICRNNTPLNQLISEPVLYEILSAFMDEGYSLGKITAKELSQSLAYLSIYKLVGMFITTDYLDPLTISYQDKPIGASKLTEDDKRLLSRLTEKGKAVMVRLLLGYPPTVAFGSLYPIT